MDNQIIIINFEFVLKQIINVGTDSKSVRINQSSNNRTGLDTVPTDYI